MPSGLTQFGVNITRIKAELQVGAAPLARERGRVHLHARRRAGAARGRRRDRAQARRCRRLARQRRHRPLPDQSHRQAMRSISRSARARRPSACTIPTSISSWSATTPAAAGCARTASRSRSSGAWPRSMPNFKLDIDADGIALITWDMPGRSMNVIDRRGDRGAVEHRREGRGRRRDQGRGHHLGQGHVLRRRRSHAAGNARRAPSTTWPRRRARRPRPRRCSRRAASCRSSTGGSRPAASRGSPRSTAPRWAAASSSPRLPPPHRRRQREDPPRPARDQGRAVSRRRRHAAHRAHDAAGRRAAIPAQGRPAHARPRQGDEADRRGRAGRRSDQAAKDWIKAGGKAKAPWDVDGFRLPGGPVYSQGRHDDVPGGERDLSPRDLRQLSGRARDPAGGLRGPAAADRPRAARSSRAISPRSCARRKRRR